MLSSYLPNVPEHAPLSAGANVEHGVDAKTTEEHENTAADRGCCVPPCSILPIPKRLHCFQLRLKNEELARCHYLVGDFIDLGWSPLQGPHGVLAKLVEHLYPAQEIEDLILEFVTPVPFQEGSREHAG